MTITRDDLKDAEQRIEKRISQTDQHFRDIADELHNVAIKLGELVIRLGAHDEHLRRFEENQREQGQIIQRNASNIITNTAALAALESRTKSLEDSRETFMGAVIKYGAGIMVVVMSAATLVQVTLKGAGP